MRSFRLNITFGFMVLSLSAAFGQSTQPTEAVPNERSLWNRNWCNQGFAGAGGVSFDIEPASQDPNDRKAGTMKVVYQPKPESEGISSLHMRPFLWYVNDRPNRYLGWCRGLRFDMYLDKPYPNDKLRVICATPSPGLFFHVDVPLDFTGWKTIRLPAEVFQKTNQPTWESIYFFQWEFTGPDPLTAYLDNISQIVPDAETLRETHFIEPVQYHAQSHVIFNKQMQVLLNTERKIEFVGTVGTCVAGRVTAMQRTLIDSFNFGFVSKTNDKSVFEPLQALADAKVQKYGGGVSAEGIATVQGRKVSVQQAATIAPNGVRLDCLYKPADVPANTQGALQLRIPSEEVAGKTAFVNGQTVSLDTITPEAPLTIPSPRHIKLSVLPGYNAGIIVERASACQFQRDANGVLVLEFLADEGNLNVILQPPFDPLEVRLATDKFHNVYEDSEIKDARLVIDVVGRGEGDAQPVDMKVTVTDFDKTTVQEWNETRTLPPGVNEQIIVPLTLPKKGYYIARLDITDRGSGRVCSDVVTIGVIRPHPLDTPFKTTDYFGSFCIAGLNDVRRQELAKKIGMQFFRAECGWCYREREKGQYDWSIPDAEMALAKKYNMGVMFYGLGETAWGTTSTNQPRPVPGDVPHSEKPHWQMHSDLTVTDIPAWREFYRRAAERYKDAFGWMPWNEFYWRLEPAHGVLLHKIAREEIKKANPNALVVANCVSPWIVSYAKEFLAKGGADSADVISYHPYHNPVAPEHPYYMGLNMVGYMTQLQDEIKKYKPNGMPIWWTEWAWLADDFVNPFVPEPGEKNRHQIIPERNQAMYLVRSHILGLSVGVEKFFQFNFGTGCTQEMGMIRIQAEGIGPRPMFCAYNTMTWMINDKTYAGKVELKPEVHGYVFAGTDENVLVFWDSQEPETKKRLLIPAPSQPYVVVDFMDNPVEVIQRDGYIELPLNGEPRYLVTREEWKTLLSNFEKAKCRTIPAEGVK